MHPQQIPEPIRLFPIATAEITPIGSDRRQGRRRMVNSAAAMRNQETRTFAVEVMDVSSGGCRIRSGAAVSEGERVLFKFAGVPLQRAQLIWQGETEIGFRFDAPLSAADLAAIGTRPAHMRR
jgi:hypothetical protein